MLSEPFLWFLGVYTSLYVGLLYFRVSMMKREEGIFPLGDDVKLMRRAGQSLERRMKDLDEKTSNAFLWAAGVPLALAWLPLALAGWLHWTWPVGWLIVSGSLLTIGMSWGVGRIIHLTIRYRRAKLGLYGERVVADQLEMLKFDGYRVVHDVPCLGATGIFNLDHVVVGGGAVAVIETKTRRKHSPADGGPNNVVTRDGDRLIWPRGARASEIFQVRNNAEWLRKQLKTGLAITAPVMAVIAIPGWWVNAPGKDPVVVNAKMLPRAVRDECCGNLTPKEEELIYLHLAHLCRDIDFEGVG